MELKPEPTLKLTWTDLKEVEASPDGSAYAEFWLNARGAAEPQRALAGVVRHIRPALVDWLRSHLNDNDKPTPDDDPPTATAK